MIWNINGIRSAINNDKNLGIFLYNFDIIFL